MAEQLYRVKISTDIMVYAKDTNEAVIVAKQKAKDEVATASYEPMHAQYVDEVPATWLDFIPYCPDRLAQIDQKCQDMVVQRGNTQVPIEPAVETAKEEVVDVKPPKPNKPPKPPKPNTDHRMPQLKFYIPRIERK